MLNITPITKTRLDSMRIYRNGKFHPRTKNELFELAFKRMREYGYDCDLNDIDVSAIDDMSNLFAGTQFCGDVSKWDVSNVKNMFCMFQRTV